jgi:hypothetical protein
MKHALSNQVRLALALSLIGPGKARSALHTGALLNRSESDLLRHLQVLRSKLKSQKSSYASALVQLIEERSSEASILKSFLRLTPQARRGLLESAQRGLMLFQVLPSTEQRQIFETLARPIPSGAKQNV